MEILLGFVLLLIIFYMIDRNRKKDITYVKSNVDGNTYIVRNTKDKQEGADRLALIKKRCDELINHIKNNSSLMEQDEFRILVDRYTSKQTEFSEKDKLSNYTSYTENKGDKIVFCMRQRNDTEDLIDLNTMMFVAIHEVAHIMTKDVGHHKDFWSNFKKLLKVSVDIGIYENEDYKATPRTYCGMKINSNPLIN
jgi:hypothetical protein